MLQQRAARLFRGVVLAGSALGCGARADDRADESAEGSPGDSQPRSSESARAPASSLSNTPAPSTPAPTVEAPMAPGASSDLLILAPPPRCEANQQLRCTASGSSEARGCACEAILPLSADDCARPEQFQCADAGAGACSCDAPSAEPGCPGFAVWYCESYAPQTPCRCLEIRIR